MPEARALCSSCDIYCQVLVETEGGQVTRVKAIDPRPGYANICMKGVHAPAGFVHPDRVLHPLRRKGPRGSGEWERVGWDEALDDIAERLRRVIDRYGPEGFAVSTSSWNTQTDQGMCRRFMNLVGSPNWISGVALCAGNTAAVNRLVYGWFPYPDFTKTQCIVLFGHNPKPHSWTPEYNAIRRAQERGAKLIVLDPRRSENAELADIWLPLRVGTDAAMCLGWLKVIMDEGLWDKDFVKRWTAGFDELRARVNEFPLDRVAEITGVPADRIAEAARLYARSGPAVIPWSPITDQQRNSTSAIRLQAILRAICGNLDVPGGEVLHGFHPRIVPETDLELHDALPEAQKAKQLGSDTHPVFTYRGAAPLEEPTLRVWGRRYANIVSGCYMATPSAVFRAMADGEPYPVKAFFALGNNTLLSFANMQLIHRALLNQDLLVAFEHMKTPTAALCDYILPGDAWTERKAMADGFGWTALCRTSQQAVAPPGEARSVYDFWRGLAVRFGLGNRFPWETADALLDHRVAALGMDFDSFAAGHALHTDGLEFRKYETTGFATPSGKVELSSSVLAELGFDPLPYWREEPAGPDDMPLRLFTGLREDAYFQTGHRHIAALRARAPEPLLFLHPEDAEEAGITDGEPAVAETAQGRVHMKAAVRDDMQKGLVRIPHGWWLPEIGLESAWEMADAQLCPDSEDFLDREQGIPHFKGIPCRVAPAAQGGIPSD